MERSRANVERSGGFPISMHTYVYHIFVHVLWHIELRRDILNKHCVWDVCHLTSGAYHLEDWCFGHPKNPQSRHVVSGFWTLALKSSDRSAIGPLKATITKRLQLLRKAVSRLGSRPMSKCAIPFRDSHWRILGRSGVRQNSSDNYRRQFVKLILVVKTSSEAFTLSDSVSTSRATLGNLYACGSASFPR